MRSVQRAGSAIVAVLLLLVIGVVVAATVLAAAEASSGATVSGQARAQARSLAWSGVQAVMAELAEQREALLEGKDPDVTAEWTLYTLDDGTRAVVRLIDLDPAGDGVLAAENAKLDINTATEEMLAGVPGLDAELAATIVAARAEGPFASVEQLLRVEGVTAELLYGDAETGEPGGTSTAPAGALPEASAELPGLGAGAVGERGLLGRLTVFSFDPNVQVGYGGEDDHFGSVRVNLDQEWSDRLERAVASRLDEQIARFVGGLIESGRTFEDDSALVQTMVDLGTDPAEWGQVLDVFTTSDDEFLPGRVDVNRASAEVLACVPGVTPEQAGAIVERRESVNPDERMLPSWVVLEGLLSPEDFVLAAPHLAARSMQWRVRLEVGLERGGEEASFDDSAPMSIDDLIASWEEPLEEPALEHRMVVEAVIDVASSRARVAYMRDVTLLEPVRALVRAEREDEEAIAGAGGPEDQPGGGVGPELEGTGAVDPFGEDLDFGSGLDLGSGTGSGLDSELDLGGGLDFGFDTEPRVGNGADADADDFGDTGGDGSNAGEGGGAGAGGGEPTGPVDRRIGRWTTRKAGSG